MTITIRPVAAADAAEIVDLLNPIMAAGTYTIMEGPFSVQDQVDFIRGFPKRGVYLAAVDDASQRVLGIQDVIPLAGGSEVFAHVGEISTFVGLDAHRTGIGQLLCRATFERAAALGFLKLMANVRGDNPVAAAFYQSQGFRRIGIARQHAFVRGAYIDEIILERFLA